jgi:membrane protein DedA with SNARE-associated domain
MGDDDAQADATQGRPDAGGQPAEPAEDVEAAGAVEREGGEEHAGGEAVEGEDGGRLRTGRHPDRRPSKRAVTLVAIPIIALIVCTNIGDATAPTLVDTHPAWLIALNPRNRNLVLVTNYLDAWTYYGIATARLLASDPLFFLLGWWYGDAAITWMEKRTRTWGKSLRRAEGWFSKAAYPLIFLAPNQYICLFAGAAGMPVAAFFAVNIAGTMFRLYLIRRFGGVFEGPLDGIVEWIGDNRVPLLVLTVTLTVASLLFEARRGETEVSAIANLDDELEAEADRLDTDTQPEAAPPQDAAPEAPGAGRPATPPPLPPPDAPRPGSSS